MESQDPKAMDSVTYPEEAPEELFADPGHFDGDYGEGSYFVHAMRKDD